MANQKPIHRKLKFWFAALAIVCVLVVGIGVYIVWYVFAIHRHDLAEATTPADVAYYTSVPPPPEARELRVAAFEAGQARSTFVRFKAPAEVCRAYAAKVMPNMPLSALTEDQTYNDLMAIYMASQWLHDLRWFDLPYATSGWTLQSGQAVFQKPAIEKMLRANGVIGADMDTEKTGYSSSSVRVDIANGVFYFFQVN
jgi:hypothetical protein